MLANKETYFKVPTVKKVAPPERKASFFPPG